jgi:two-component sensor histidine kinase
MDISKRLIFVLLLINLSVLKAQNIYIGKNQGKAIVKKTKDNLKIDNLLNQAIELQETDIVKAKAKCDEAYKLLENSCNSNGVIQYYLVRSTLCRHSGKLNAGIYFAKKAQNQAKILNNYEKHIEGCVKEAYCLNTRNSDYIKTIKYINRKLDSLKNGKECKELADLYFLLGKTYSRKEEFDNSIKQVSKSISIYKKINFKFGLQSCYFELAELYHLTNNLKNAQFYIEKSLSLIDNETKLNSQDYARSLAKYAEILHAQNEAEKALMFSEKALKIQNGIKNYGQDNWYVLSTYIVVNYTLKNYNRIIELAIFELQKDNNLIEKNVVLNVYIAMSYVKLGNSQIAKIYIDRAIKTINDNPKTIIQKPNLASMYDFAATIHFNLKQHEKAYFYLDKYVVLKEEINSEQTKQNIIKLETEFLTAQKEADIKQLKIREKLNALEIEKKENNFFRAVFLNLITIIFIIILAFLFKKQKNKNKAIESKNTLLNENKLILEKTLAEKNILIKEIHHRVKNNLQLVMCLLNIQSRKNNNDEINDFIEKGQTRISSMSLIHQNLYQSDNLESVNFHDYLLELIESIKNCLNDSKKIEFNVNVQSISFDIQTAIPLGLIINELVCNSIKYAFPNEAYGKINIQITYIKSDEKYILFYSDDGIGMDINVNNKPKSIGLKLIKLLTEQLNGTIKTNSLNGLEYEIIFNNDKQ